MRVPFRSKFQMTAITCAATISAAYAATIPSLVAAQDAPNAGLEEVIVTARKRAESLQDVPVAVTALTGGMIERGNINSVVEVAKLAPNVELIAQPFAGAALAASADLDLPPGRSFLLEGSRGHPAAGTRGGALPPSPWRNSPACIPRTSCVRL